MLILQIHKDHSYFKKKVSQDELNILLYIVQNSPLNYQ